MINKIKEFFREKNTKDLVINKILILIGFLSCLIYFYHIFIRERLPKTLPFILTEFNFYILLYICLIYCFLLKQLLYPKTLSPLFFKVLTIIGKPFMLFDFTLKNNSYSKKSYFQLVLNISKKIAQKSIKEKTTEIGLFQLLPRIILLLIFMVDVFYLHKIENFYYFIFLSLGPFLYAYYQYSILAAYEQYLAYLETFYDTVSIYEEGNYDINGIYFDDDTLKGFHNEHAIYHDKSVTLRDFIEIQTTTHDTFEYYGYPSTKEDVLLLYKKNLKINNETLNEDDYNIIHNDFYTFTPVLINLNTYLKKDKDILNIPFIHYTKVCIYILYFICWLYILIISVPSLQNISCTLDTLKVLTNYSIINEPYSDVNFTLQNDAKNTSDIIVLLLTMLCKSEYIKILLLNLVIIYNRKKN